MTTVLIVRHGLTASTGKALTGWRPGVSLDDRGRQQAASVAARLAGLRLAAIVSSPLERCQQTAEIIGGAQAPALPGDSEASGDRDRARVRVQTDDRLGECPYRDRTGER